MQIRIHGPIGHCSVRLRKFLDIEEEQACRWRVKVRRNSDGKKKGGGRRWVVTPEFGVPGPFTSRPRSAQGCVTFHFSQVTVSKGPGGTSVVTIGACAKDLGPSAAAEHDRYATREDAVLTLSEGKFEQYFGRPNAVEKPDGRTPAILSNISDDAAERYEYWLKVHEHEREAKPDRLVFHRNRLSVSGWRALAIADSLPEEVRDIAADMANRPLASSRAKGDASLEMDRAEAYKVQQSVRDLLGMRPSREPIRVAKGRSGRTQYRLTAEFPAGLDVGARLRILKQFCQALEDLGVMYTAAIHSPDEHNDKRNEHLHIAYYDRPCSRLPDGRWDFEVAEEVKGQHNRFRYPYRQPKIGELSRCPDGGNPRAYRASVIYSMREHFAELCNEELIKIGSSRLFDPRRYSEMGIDQTPTKPLGPKAAPLEAAGVPTRQGIENAEVLWTYRLEQMRKECAKRRNDRAQLIAKLDDIVSEMDGSNDAGAARLRARSVEARTFAAVLDTHELEMEEFAVTLEMAYARPDKVAETCARILESLGKGKGSKSDRKDQALIAERKVAAEAFISEIDAIRDQSLRAIEPILKEVDVARAQIERLADELSSLRDRADTSVTGVGERADGLAVNHAERIAGASLHERIDEVLTRVVDQHLVHEPSAKQVLYTVPGISREEFQLLNTKHLSPWIQARLASIAATQTKRAREAASLCRQFGLEGLAARAGESSKAQRALHHIAAYRDHPVIRSLHEEGTVRPQKVTSDPVNPVVAEHSLGSSHDQCSNLDTRAEARGAATEISRDIAVAPSRWTPSNPRNSNASQGPDASREQAITAYADFVRTGAGVEIVKVDGVQRVDPKSLHGSNNGEEFDWRISASVFEEEEVVQAAIKDRVARDRVCEREAAMVAEAAEQENDRQRTRDRIMQELHQCGTRPVLRRQNRWVVSGLSPDLIDPANAWQDHPELASAYDSADLVWRVQEAKEARSQIARADFLYPVEPPKEEQVRLPSKHSPEPHTELWSVFKDRGGQGI